MALPATDTFDDVNFTTLPAHSSWVASSSSQFSCVNNYAVLSTFSGSADLIHWSGDTFNDNHYSQAVSVNSGAGAGYIGVACRVIGSTVHTGYYFYASKTTSYFEKTVGGSVNTFATLGAFTNGHTIKITASGTTISIYDNGSAFPGSSPQTDSAITSGYAGLAGYNADNDSPLNNWQGGNLLSSSLSGDAANAITEASIIAGGKTIILTISGDTWVADDGTFAGQRQNIINGIDSNQSEAGGWDAVVKATQGVSGVVRTSDTVVTITLDAFSSFSINFNETITATIPGTAVVGGSAIVTTPTFTVTAQHNVYGSAERYISVGNGMSRSEAAV